MGSAEDDKIQDALAEYKARIARAGGIGRAKKLSAERRKEIATKASKAAAKARTKKAQNKKKQWKMKKSEYQTKAQEGSAYIVRGFEILRELAEADHDSELSELIEKQLEAFRKIAKIFQN